MKKKKPLERSHKILIGCILFSIFFHIGALICINHQLLWIYSPYNNLFLARQAFGNSFDLKKYEDKTKEQVLSFFIQAGKQVFFSR